MKAEIFLGNKGIIEKGKSKSGALRFGLDSKTLAEPVTMLYLIC